jgi:hypothetical protein
VTYAWAPLASLSGAVSLSESDCGGGGGGGGGGAAQQRGRAGGSSDGDGEGEGDNDRRGDGDVDLSSDLSALVCKCREAAAGNQVGAFLACVTLAPALAGCFNRRKVKSDSNLQKVRRRPGNTGTRPLPDTRNRRKTVGTAL